MFEKLKSRWKLQTNGQVIAVLLVFSLSGSMIMPVRKFVFHLLHFDGHTPFLVKTLAWLIVVFPTYQFFLLVFGALFGEFPFFWEKEKKMGRWFLRRLGLREDPALSSAETL